MTKSDCDVARADADEFVRSAAELDGALAEVERAFTRFRLSGLNLSRSLRRAGVSDEGRIPLSIDSALRCAAWKWSPSFADSAHVLRAQQRAPLAVVESARRLVPSIPR